MASSTGTEPPLAAVVEAALFIGSRPLTLAAVLEFAPATDEPKLASVLGTLNARYERQSRPYAIVQRDGGWKLELKPEFSSWLRERLRPDRGVKLSRPQLEVLAAVAYRQPISRAGIEHLTKSDAGPAVRQLLRRRLIATVDSESKDAGSSLYATTQRFLEVFRLASIVDLPTVEELVVDQDQERQTP